MGTRRAVKAQETKTRCGSMLVLSDFHRQASKSLGCLSVMTLYPKVSTHQSHEYNTGTLTNYFVLVPEEPGTTERSIGRSGRSYDPTLFKFYNDSWDSRS